MLAPKRLRPINGILIIWALLYTMGKMILCHKVFSQQPGDRGLCRLPLVLGMVHTKNYWQFTGSGKNLMHTSPISCSFSASAPSRSPAPAHAQAQYTLHRSSQEQPCLEEMRTYGGQLPPLLQVEISGSFFIYYSCSCSCACFISVHTFQNKSEFFHMVLSRYVVQLLLGWLDLFMH